MGWRLAGDWTNVTRGKLGGDLETFLLVSQTKFLDECIKGALEDGVEFVERQIDAMVGDAVLWEIVSTDPFAPITAANLDAAIRGPFTLHVPLLLIEDTSTQHAHGLGAIFVL